MTRDRMSRSEFFAKVSALSDDDLRAAMWTLYWRGTAAMRERVEAVIDPATALASAVARNTPRDAAAALAEVEYFTELASHGAYLAGDRRVSPKERGRWRFTFRRLATDAQDALRGTDPETASKALALMVDLACRSRDWDMFRSEDPMEAARFVVSDVVEALWFRMRVIRGATGFLGDATRQLVCWESEYGWTRYGQGWVADKERQLADVLAGMLTTPDLWRAAGEAYLAALDRVDLEKPNTRKAGMDMKELSSNLSQWNGLLIDHLTAPDEAALVDRIITHPALRGPEAVFLQARVARDRGDLTASRRLIAQCLKSLPGHYGFRAFAEEIGVPIPD